MKFTSNLFELPSHGILIHSGSALSLIILSEINPNLVASCTFSQMHLIACSQSFNLPTPNLWLQFHGTQNLADSGTISSWWIGLRLEVLDPKSNANVQWQLSILWEDKKWEINWARIKLSFKHRQTTFSHSQKRNRSPWWQPLVWNPYKPSPCYEMG